MNLTVGIGLLGCGTVGSAVADRSMRERDAIERRSSVRYDLRAVAIRDPAKARPHGIADRVFTRDARALIDDPHVDLIVECIGGTGDAAEFVERALGRGRHVVTVNKDLLATQGPRLHTLAAARAVTLRFEGAVAGAIPIVRTLDDALTGDRVDSVAGAVNGTCSSILAAMEGGADYAAALADAQRLGYAEPDPSKDVDGVDAAHKLALLIQLAFGLAVISPRIRRAGIANVARRDIARARMLGLRAPAAPTMSCASPRAIPARSCCAAPAPAARPPPRPSSATSSRRCARSPNDMTPPDAPARTHPNPPSTSCPSSQRFRALANSRSIRCGTIPTSPMLRPRQPRSRTHGRERTIPHDPNHHRPPTVPPSGAAEASAVEERGSANPPLTHFDTIALHAGFDGDPATRSRAVPIYQTTSYRFDSTEHAGKLFALESFGNIYTRINNPTTDVLERRLAALEGGVGALAVASGQAAAVYSILNLARAGGHIVSSASLYGGTYNAFANTLPRFGIDVALLDFADLDAIAAAIKPNTKAIYAETIGNPKMDVLDIERVAAIAHAHGLPLIVDNTLATPYLLRPIEWGADIVVHSATKFIGGHGTAIGGAIVDSVRFDWTQSPRFADFVDPDPSYDGLRYAAAFGQLADIVKARVQLLRDLGAAISPFNAWLLLQGLETLGIRIERHVANAQAVAAFLFAHPSVASVSYPGLPGDVAYERAHRYLPNGAGSILTFRLRADEIATKRFIDRLQLFSLLANVGDAKSLVIHPASTTHRQLTPKERLRSGVDESTIRLSIGLEDRRDIIADLTQAFDAA